jgi:molecular chaperone GrpE
MPSRKHKSDATPKTPLPPDAETPAVEQTTVAANLEHGQPLEQQLEQQLAQQRQDLAAAQAKAQEYLDGWQRERADFFNYKRRNERDLSQGAQIALGSALRRYLDIADDLERALRNRPQDGDGVAWAIGIDLVYHKLLSAFEADGVKLIETKGHDFDPAFHEAISQEDSPDLKSGQIIGVVQTGYTLGERVLRPARVRVAR